MKKHNSQNIFTQVTKVFIDALKTGAPPWRRPWTPTETVPGFPVNAGTERRYSGVNITILWASAIARGYECDRWLTFRQTAKLGARIRKGEKGTMAVLFKKIDAQRAPDPDDDDEQNQVNRNYRIARAYTLFNVEQCIGLPAKVAKGNRPKFTLEPDWQSHQHADSLVGLCGAKVRHVGNVATYIPASDVICIPPKGAFHSPAGYYSTLMHELTHWTGHRSRLNRVGIVESYPFQSVGYAFEELVAEIGSAFLCADYQIFGELCHDSYVMNWIKILENDPKAIFRASAQAWKARNYLVDQIPDIA